MNNIIAAILCLIYLLILVNVFYTEMKSLNELKKELKELLKKGDDYKN